MTRYFVALALTIGVEALVLAALARVARSPRRPLLLAGCCINLVTHPLANLAYTGTPGSFVAVEAAVVVAEALLYAWLLRTGFTRALLCSAVANGASMALSPLLAAP